MKKLSILVAMAFVFFSCNDCQKEKNHTENLIELEGTSLIGRKAVLLYPEFKAEVSYLTDSTLHWKTILPDGTIDEGNEDAVIKKLNKHQFFLNWIEKDGTSISQIIELKDNSVFVFCTFADEENPRGGRSSAVLEGSFEFVD
ncbi:MAG: hypothetical protein Q4G08_04610 [Capnocytophaga sp.]|nr:hypothetical protein [Capnocytophaga sp.]